MKKLVLFFGLLLCGLVVNGRVSGIKKYEAHSGNPIGNIVSYDDKISIILEVNDKCGKKDSLFLQLDFVKNGKYLIDDNRIKRFVLDTNSYGFYTPVDPNFTSFNIIDSLSNRKYPVKIILKKEHNDLVGGTVYNNPPEGPTPLKNILSKTNTGLFTFTNEDGYFEFSEFSLQNVNGITFYSEDFSIGGMYVEQSNFVCPKETRGYTKAYALKANDLSINFNSSQNRPSFTMPY